VIPRVSTNRFLDIRARVQVEIEQGLFSVAFAPDFKASGHFFVNYTRGPDGATVVSRFSLGANTNSIDAGSEQVLLVVSQPSPVHNGGQIAFGPDGYLYIGMGDGGPQNDPSNAAQNPTNLLGRMLRIDVSGSTTNYTIPPTNPFVGRDNFAPAIWATGLRNPWRFSFDALTGDLYIADVGEARMEEINFQAANSSGGENYGWSLFEGALPFKTELQAPKGLIFPVATYGRTAGRSVTGGVVIRTSATNRSNGVYIYSDFVTGRVFGLKRLDDTWHHADFGIARNPGGQPLTLISFSVDEMVSVYGVDGTVSGLGSGIFRVRDQLRAHAPTFSMTNGTYQNEQNLVLRTLTADARIHYTVDGSEPDETSRFVLSGETLSIKETTTVRAKAYREDLAPSPISVGNYTFAVRLSVNPGKGPVTNGTQLTIWASISTDRQLAGLYKYFNTLRQ
jgi:hypothetical protein